MTKPMRREDWPERLAEYISERAGQPFVWGENDCAQFAAGAIRSILPSPSIGWAHLGKYSNARAARKLLKKEYKGGLESLCDYYSTLYGFESISVKFAQRGDVALFDSKLGPTLGIVSMDGCHVLAPGIGGLERVPLGSCRRAWRV